jgi:hypothetical protein
VREGEEEKNMVAPTFKKATDTASDPTNVKYGAPDLKYAFDVLDGTHASHRIQAANIQGLLQPYNATVRVEGSDFVTRDKNGALLYSGTNATTALQTALNQAGHIYIGPGTYNISATLLCPSNTHVEANVNTIVRGTAHPNALAGLIKNENQSGSSPQINNSYIIIEGGTWDGNAEYDVNVPSTMTQGSTIIGNIHLFLVEFAWVHHVKSINSLGENIKIRSCSTTWVTNNFCSKARLDDTGSGRAGIMVTSLGGREAICANNIIYDAGGEAIGVNRLCDRVIVVNNICKVTQAGNGRGYILLESVGDETQQIIRNCIIANNSVSCSYQCINIRSSDGVTVANNNLTNIGAGIPVGEASAGGDGIRLVGLCKNIVIVGNVIRDVEHHGMLLTGECSNVLVADNIITDVGRGAVDTYDGIQFNISGPWNGVKVANNMISDNRTTKRMSHGIFFDVGAATVENCWIHKNKILGQLHEGVNLVLGTGRFQNGTRIYANSGRPAGRNIATPFNNTDGEVGLPLHGGASYAAVPTSGTSYTVLPGSLSISISGGTGLQVVVEDPSGNNIVTNASSLTGMFLARGWIFRATYTGAPSSADVRVHAH